MTTEHVRASRNANGEQTGQTLGGTSYALAFDYDGQLTQITQGQNTTDFVYDALGRRYSRTAGGTTTVFYYAGSAIVLEKQGDTFTAVYAYGNALLRRNSEYPLYDGHGSERTVTNGSQTVTGTINFEAFGQTVGTSGSSDSPYMYAGARGYRTDGDAGLMLVGARYYDAQVGRFITRDTVLSEHPHLYCEHDPVNGVDPSGNTWHYDRRTGDLFIIDVTLVNPYIHIGYGFSGKLGPWRNNPDMDDQIDEGPLPAGEYTIGPPRDHKSNGAPLPYNLTLSPSPTNDMKGRTSFLIHGGSAQGDPSHGCIVLPKPIRQRIWRSGDHRLIVH